MAEVEIKKVSKKYANYISKHLPEEHPTVRGHIKIESEKPKRRKLYGTVFTGRF